ncbi:uncharacterized protein A4U43_C05F16390 [Asparagus officinalis]|uniref:RRM domain-containing protein n=1 Tax=Asparagus officinalis TaxID=4686 RepID=A0A5P1ET30_ASPOF|nr:uncharacterized protein A4U43_C05F16390 [Asparagus officinalis]
MDEAWELFGGTPEMNVASGNCLIDEDVKCWSLYIAGGLLQRMPVNDQVTWDVVMRGSHGFIRELDPKNADVTQVSFGGFTEKVSAEELANFLEYAVGTIYRCRLKTSWTPPDSYPDYKIIDAVDSLLPLKDSYNRAVPHAFVHFAVSDAAKRAIDAAERCELILNGHHLRAILGSMGSSFHVSRRRTMDPIKFPNL